MVERVFAEDAVVAALSGDEAEMHDADGESLALGRHATRWLDAPHVPHGWECGYLFGREGGRIGAVGSGRLYFLIAPELDIL